MQFTMVSEVPLASSATFCATSVENKGESAMTTDPQTNKKISSAKVELPNKKNGDSKQHEQERNNAVVAIFFAAKRCDNKPLATQASEPHAMIKKEKSGTFKPVL